MGKFIINCRDVYIHGDKLAGVSDVMNLIPRMNYDQLTDLANILDISAATLSIVANEYVEKERLVEEEIAKASIKEAK